jgi:RNA polymerase sigma factor (sigma-70 family)
MMDHARRLARWGRELPDAGRPTGARESSERGSPDGRSMESRVQVFRFAAFLREQWPTLPEAERDVLRMRYFEGVPVRAVAAHLGVSGATVLRLEQKAIDVLRERYLASVGRRAR